MRLHGRAKAGFYPTPNLIVEKIADSLITDHSENYRILDPCCGTGDALEIIGTRLRIKETYGIELDKKRAAISKEKLMKVIEGSYTHLRSTESAYSLLFLNPPYDSDTQHKRLEHEFLIDTTVYLTVGGVLVFLIPHNQLIPKTARYLAYWYRDIKVFRFPDEEYQAFHQIIMFGVKKDRYSRDAQAEEFLNTIPLLPKEEIPVIQRNNPLYTLPKISGHFWFRSQFLNPADCRQEIDQFGLWDDQSIKEILFPQNTEKLKPLMPLRKGHLAMLIGAGLMDNLQVEKDGQTLLIKGKTEKKVHYRQIEEEGQNTTVETDYITTNVMVLNLLSGELQTIQ